MQAETSKPFKYGAPIRISHPGLDVLANGYIFQDNFRPVRSSGLDNSASEKLQHLLTRESTCQTLNFVPGCQASTPGQMPPAPVVPSFEVRRAGHLRRALTHPRRAVPRVPQRLYAAHDAPRGPYSACCACQGHAAASEHPRAALCVGRAVGAQPARCRGARVLAQPGTAGCWGGSIASGRKGVRDKARGRRGARFRDVRTSNASALRAALPALTLRRRGTVPARHGAGTPPPPSPLPPLPHLHGSRRASTRAAGPLFLSRRPPARARAPAHRATASLAADGGGAPPPAAPCSAACATSAAIMRARAARRVQHARTQLLMHELLSYGVLSCSGRMIDDQSTD